MDEPFDPVLIGIIREKLNDIVPLDHTVGISDELSAWGFHSLNIMKLIVELELELSIEFDDFDLLLEKFSTIEKVYGMVKKAQQSAQELHE
ncbi:acyl carrier protein [Paenibacillus sambharensis]|nr:acyl carrier protein [Paenibacillus sambharensis]